MLNPARKRGLVPVKSLGFCIFTFTFTAPIILTTFNYTYPFRISTATLSNVPGKELTCDPVGNWKIGELDTNVKSTDPIQLIDCMERKCDPEKIIARTTGTDVSGSDDETASEADLKSA